jgi:hypothetical protein
MKIEKIQKIISNICENKSTTESDIGLLFVFLRPQFSKDKILLDISNFITHSEGRTKGASFDHVYTFVKSLISTSKSGGTILGLPPLFKSEDVIERFSNVLEKMGILFDKQLLMNQKELVIDNLQKLMTGTEFEFTEPEVVKCYTLKERNKMFFCMNPLVNTALIKMPPTMTIRGHLFD